MDGIFAPKVCFYFKYTIHQSRQSMRVLVVSWLFIAGCFLRVISVNAQSSDELVTQAWQALQTSQYRTAEQLFTKALSAQPNYARAHIGLSYYYVMQRRYAEAWSQYNQALQTFGANNDAYVYASLTGPMAQHKDATQLPAIYALLQQLVSSPDATGTLSAMCREQLGNAMLSQGKIDKAKEHFAATGGILQWALIGPFDNVSGSGFNIVYPPEKEINRTATYKGSYDAPTKWFVPNNHRYDRWIDMERNFISGLGTFYANTFVYSPTKQTVQLRIGTSGAFKLFLNDEVILQTDDEYNNDLDTYIAQTELQQGWNNVLVKCASSEIQRCNFLLRITNPQGNPIEGVNASTDVQKYTSKPNATVTILPNRFEEYFKKQIAEHPDYLENYLLLADCYIRNDKGEDAEITLLDALKRSPNSVLISDKLMEAYMRNNKRDEIASTLEQLWQTDSTIINALEYKFNDAVKNKNYDEADRLLEKMRAVSPDSETTLQYKISLLAAKSSPDVSDEYRKAYAQYPNNLSFVTSASILEMQTKRGFVDAIVIWEKYLKSNYNLQALASLAELEYQNGNMDRWLDYRNKMLELTNNSPVYLYEMANVYVTREEFEKAYDFAQRIPPLCPGASKVYEMLGQIARKLGNTEKAKEYYRTSLQQYPGDFKVRDVIRELEGRKPIFSVFSKYNIDSLVKRSPKTADFPDDPSVVLLEDNKYYVHPEGGSECLREMLVRVLTQDGIDNWKEVNLGDVEIEKAVSIKANGTEVRADESDGSLVFKTLQEGDFVYMRWHEYSMEGGRFLKHFEHRADFDGDIPYKLIRFSVHVPKDYTLNYKANNMPKDPIKRQTEEGSIYEWKQENLTAIKTESSMPDFDEVGKFVQVTSIDSWQFVSDWYREVTNKKAKPTYEVRNKVQELLGDASKLNEEEILRRVYQFITDSIRYSMVSFRQSGYVPQKARDVLITRIGDCKDVATLGISMLRVANIKADYMLVKTGSSAYFNQLPTTDFDHVIIRVHGKNGFRYLDLTASNYPMGTVPFADVDAFALCITPETKNAEHLNRNYFVPSAVTMSSSATLNTNGDISVRRTSTYTGGLSAAIRSEFRNQGKKDNEKSIVESLSTMFPNVKLTSLEFSNLDSLAHSCGIVESFNAPRYLNDAGNFKTLKLPWLTGAELDETFSYEERTYAIDYDPGYDTSTEEITIALPSGFVPEDIKPQVRFSSALADYSVTYAHNNNQLVTRRTYIVKKRRIEPHEYKSVKEFYNNVVREDTKQILLRAAGVGKGKKK